MTELKNRKNDRKINGGMASRPGYPAGKIRRGKRRFTGQCWEGVDRCMALLLRWLDMAESSSDALDAALSVVRANAGRELDTDTQKEILRILKGVKCADPSDAVKIAMLLYDKAGDREDREQTEDRGRRVGFDGL